MKTKTSIQERALELLKLISATIFLLLMLVLTSPADAYQGRLQGARIDTCGAAGCVRIESETLDLASSGRVLAGEAATVRWLNKAGQEIRSLRVLQPVLYMNDDLLMWEGDENDPTAAGTLDLVWGESRSIGQSSSSGLAQK